jgi:hypothetical protein
VLEALRWAFHNAKRGLLPELRANRRGRRLRLLVYRRGAQALESCGVLSWVHRLERVREPFPDLLGDNGFAPVAERTCRLWLSAGRPARPR